MGYTAQGEHPGQWHAVLASAAYCQDRTTVCAPFSLHRVLPSDTQRRWPGFAESTVYEFDLQLTMGKITWREPLHIELCWMCIH